MKLIAHVVDGHRIDARPAPVERDWMDDPSARHAYRCLPLAIANASGWELLAPAGFTALWNGDPAVGSIHVEPDPGTHAPASDHFGAGVLTFHIPCLFRTPPGIDLFVTGPLNSPKDGIAPLTGIIETDWSIATFTMNWRFTRPGVTIRFEAGEPFAHLMPTVRGLVEQVEPEWALMSDDPELATAYGAWADARKAFNEDLVRPGRAADAPQWQKDYHRGLGATGRPIAPADHRTRLKVRPFVRRSRERPGPEEGAT
ncbi:MAG: DUF6065 family protein [Burkholderiales bacterium]|jgi:hypothetical protein|nr:DUF6065 family protein [Burkholderiales bacterium]